MRKIVVITGPERESATLLPRSLRATAATWPCYRAIRSASNKWRSNRGGSACVSLTAVDLPAVNTPQFDRARNKMGKKARPVPPIFQPEVAARAIYFGAFHPRRQIWVGFPTVKAIIANRIAPGLLDRYLAKSGYSGQLSDEPSDPDAPGNLFTPVIGAYGAHGRFDDQARKRSWEMFAGRHPKTAWGAVLIGLAIVAYLLVTWLKT